MGGGVLRDQGRGEPRADGVEQANGLINVVHDLQADLGGLLPLPLAAQVGVGDGLDEGFFHRPLGAAHSRAARAPAFWQAVEVGLGDVKLAAAAAHARRFQRRQKHRDQHVGVRVHDAADIERVADLSVQRVEHGGIEPIRIRRGVGHQPGPACAVQADRRPGLARDGAQLGHDRAGAARDGQRQTRVGEHRPACSMGGAIHQDGGARRQSRLGQRRIQRLGDDGARGAQRVGSDPEDHGVAAPDHPGGVGEDIGPALEHEPDHAQRGHQLVDRPAGMLHPLQQPVARRLGVAPHSQGGDHVGPHGVRRQQSGRGATARPGHLHVCGIGGGDGGPDRTVLQSSREGFKEGGDGGVGHRPHGGERLGGAGHGGGGGGGLSGRDVQQIASVLDHHQPVARSKCGSQAGRHIGDAVSAERNRLTGHERVQPSRVGGAGVPA